MAYNVLKGEVEGSVDQHADQEIGGVKVFKNTISASVFYDTDAQSPCATLKDVAITTIQGNPNGTLLIYTDKQTATATSALTFRAQILAAPSMKAAHFEGSAAGLHDLPADKFVGSIPAQHIDFGPGLHNVRGKLQLKGGPGLQIDEDGIGVAIDLKSGLKMRHGYLTIDPTRAPDIKTDGQNLSDGDTLLVGDTSRGSLQSTTLGNFYDRYIKTKAPNPAGSTSEIQLKGRTGFDATSQLSYNISQEVLNVEGKTVTDRLEVKEKLSCRGSIFTNVKMIVEESYTVKDEDYTLFCDAHKNSISVTLPPACNSRGRIIIIKKTNTDKYNLRSFPLVIKVEEGTIDINDKIVLKINYSSRTLQSDGKNWWVIGAKGT